MNDHKFRKKKNLKIAFCTPCPNNICNVKVGHTRRKNCFAFGDEPYNFLLGAFIKRNREQQIGIYTLICIQKNLKTDKIGEGICLEEFVGFLY